MVKTVEIIPEFTAWTRAFAQGIGAVLQEEGSGLGFILFICDQPDPEQPKSIRLAFASSVEMNAAISMLDDFSAATKLKLEHEGAGHA
jgi:hypothetical protein